MSQNISQNLSGYPYSATGYVNPNQIQPNFSAAGTPISNGAMVDNNPLLNAAASTPDNPLKFLGAAGASTVALFGINNLINKPLQSKIYDDTFFKKVETTVDKFGNSPRIKSFIETLENLNKAAQKRIDNSEILRTLFRKQSIGGSQVQSQAAGSKGHLANRAIEVMKKYKEKNPGFTEFDNILRKAEKESYKYYDEIISTIQKSTANKTELLGKRPWWGLGMVKNNASLREILNKARLIDSYKGIEAGAKRAVLPGAAKITLGQKTAGYLMRATECLTNGMFSGKGQVLIQALMIAQSFNEASKAEKGEKFSTFMASLAELMAFMATMGIQMRVVNHIAGLKYIGMSPENVKNYQKAMRIANQAAKYGDQKAYAKMARYMEALKNEAKANTKWYQKPIKWIGKVMSYGRIRETLKPLKSSKTATAFAKIPYGLKVGVGYAGRIAFLMGVVIPIFSGIAKKISYGIFGKPVKTLEKEKNAENAQPEQQQPQQTQQPTQPQTMQPVQQPQMVQQPQQTAKPGNLLDTMTQMQQQNNIASQPMLQTPQAASTISPDAGIKRTYIPNPILGVENDIPKSASRTAQIDAILRQADIAEANAQRFL